MTEDITALPVLRNQYFALRHGHSVANEKHIIISDPTLGVTGYGLTSRGQSQVRATAAQLSSILDGSCKIVSSDFLRARETAGIVAERLSSAESVCYSTRLRERNFGDLDGRGDEHYLEVWSLDEENSLHQHYGVESAISVVDRTVSLVLELEGRYQGEIILLVSHGDVLQLLQTAFEGVGAASHRQLSPLGVAELRPLSRRR